MLPQQPVSGKLDLWKAVRCCQQAFEYAFIVISGAVKICNRPVRICPKTVGFPAITVVPYLQAQ